MTRIYRLLALLLLAGSTAHADISGMAPAFELPGTDKTVRLADYRGKVVYLDFWASWCSPCKDSFPWMNAMQEKYRDQDVVFIAVNVDRKTADAQTFLRHSPAQFIVAFDPQGKTPTDYQLMGMPTAFVIGRDGSIVHQHIGFNATDSDRYEQHIRQAL